MSSPFDVLTSGTFDILKKDLPDPRRVARDMAINSMARELFVKAIMESADLDADLSPTAIRQIARWCKDAAIIFHDEISE
jgi:hypothetical protein